MFLPPPAHKQGGAGGEHSQRDGAKPEDDLSRVSKAQHEEEAGDQDGERDERVDMSLMTSRTYAGPNRSIPARCHSPSSSAMIASTSEIKISRPSPLLLCSACGQLPLRRHRGSRPPCLSPWDPCPRAKRPHAQEPVSVFEPLHGEGRDGRLHLRERRDAFLGICRYGIHGLLRAPRRTSASSQLQRRPCALYVDGCGGLSCRVQLLQ